MCPYRQQGGLLQFSSCRHVQASSLSVAVSSQRRHPPGVLGQEERPHHPIAPGPSLVARPGVEFYLYPTVGTVLIHSAKPELTE